MITIIPEIKKFKKSVVLNNTADLSTVRVFKCNSKNELILTQVNDYTVNDSILCIELCVNDDDEYLVCYQREIDLDIQEGKPGFPEPYCPSTDDILNLIYGGERE